MGAIRRDSESESSKIEAATAITAIPTMPHPTHLIYLPPTGAERYAQSEEVVQIIIELSAQLWHAQVSQQPQLHIRYTVVHPKVAYERVRPPCQVQSRLPGQYRVLHITRQVLTRRFGICRPLLTIVDSFLS